MGRMKKEWDTTGNDDYDDEDDEDSGTIDNDWT